jgi:hypothetical protein
VPPQLGVVEVIEKDREKAETVPEIVPVPPRLDR